MLEKEKVLVGKKNYLFLHNDTNHVIEQTRGTYPLKELHCEKFSMIQIMRKYFLKSKNVQYYLLIAPNKESVYSQFLPDEIEKSPERIVTKIIRELRKVGFKKISYSEDLLIKESRVRETYSKGDTHWNYYGAYIAYRELIKLISYDFFNISHINESDINFMERDKKGDLLSKISDNHDSVIVADFHKTSYKTFDNEIPNNGHMMIFENKNKALPTCIFFRDSFGGYIVEYLAESFSKLIVLHQNNIDYSIVLKENPDIVISEQVERFLIGLPDDVHGKFNKEVVHLKKGQT